MGGILIPLDDQYFVLLSMGFGELRHRLRRW